MILLTFAEEFGEEEEEEEEGEDPAFDKIGVGI